MPLAVTEKQVRDAYRHVANDSRWGLRHMDRMGTSYSRCGAIGIGYQFPHDRTARGKIRFNQNDESWFVCVEVNGCSTNVPIGITGPSEYADVASAIEQLFEIN